MGKRVLIVDDEKNMRWVLGQSLSGDGFEVAEAADGKEALAAVSEQEPDIMVLDHRMPRWTAWRFCGRCGARATSFRSSC